jgi:hypothetical protein
VTTTAFKDARRHCHQPFATGLRGADNLENAQAWTLRLALLLTSIHCSNFRPSLCRRQQVLKSLRLLQRPNSVHDVDKTPSKLQPGRKSHRRTQPTTPRWLMSDFTTSNRPSPVGHARDAALVRVIALRKADGLPKTGPILVSLRQVCCPNTILTVALFSLAYRILATSGSLYAAVEAQGSSHEPRS